MSHSEILKHAEPVAQKVAAGASYVTGGGLVLGDWLDVLDSHAGAFGVMIGVCTMLINWYYARQRSKRDRRK